MRRPQDIVHSRARVTDRYALLPREGFPASRLPAWGQSPVFVLASPRLGADFVQLRIELPAGQRGGYAADGQTQTFFYLLTGDAQLSGDAGERPLTPGSFGLITPTQSFHLEATRDTELLVLRKRYEPSETYPAAVGHLGHASQVEQTVWADNPSSLLQTLIPDDPAFDLALNIFTFKPGCGLPVVETHVMEHGLWYLDGRGLYYLEDRWLEVQAGDFIWMGPYCPQSFVAAGPEPSRYLYYKNVNRDIPL